ncbi:MAG: RluA family pseudouridine synthase, partial [Malacoplasma sp.]
RYNGFSLIECKLETGRTHQIRVHLKYIGNPIINDPIYGKDKNTTEYCQYLFANQISFIHPFTKKNVFVNLKTPKEFLNYIKDNG